jgi:hypothetical protein
MEQEEPPAAVALIEGFDTANRGLEQALVRFTMGPLRIRVIRVQAKEQIGLLVGEIADLKLFRLGRIDSASTSIIGTTTSVRQASGIPESLKSIFGRVRGGKSRVIR